MHSPFRRLAVTGIAQAADENFVTHAGWVQRHVAGMSVRDADDLVVIDSGLPSDTFNYVCRARIPPEHVTRRAAEAIEYFRRVGRPFSWWVGPADHPMHLGQVLQDLGLERAETELAMVADLTEPQSPAPAAINLTIRRVQTSRELRTFAEINAANWSPPDSNVLRFYDLAQSVMLARACPMRLYVGYVGEVGVATAELTDGGNVAGLYNIATLEDFRRRGIGTALTHHLLSEARAHGRRAAVLQAAADGVGIYERLGFRKFGDITEYKPHA
jgi:ribosomal protein S18 acetylase RimI-like enzyme